MTLYKRFPFMKKRSKATINLFSQVSWIHILCLDAQTIVPHTERDSSYTIISVPNQNTSRTSYKNNQTSFEFYINNDKVIVIPMSIGTIVCFSGFLLTHRQHKKHEKKDTNPFINLVSYNSKCLFSHILSSIQRNSDDGK